jgi:hypothetical protein
LSSILSPVRFVHTGAALRGRDAQARSRVRGKTPTYRSLRFEGRAASRADPAKIKIGGTGGEGAFCRPYIPPPSSFDGIGGRR